ncbi:13E12 repeat family protein, partial [Geodermatophilus sp. YIM 151500]|uniref:13E12 repeat family protein n=1 Tax=Geodermatophilus sp. YIM 151500 TaxID=2984531 RepID=UPI0021E49797
MGELASALDALAADDLDGLSHGALLDRVHELVAAQNRITAELTRTVHRAELRQAAEHDGLRSMSSWLRGHARLSGAAATRLLTAGRALDLLPATTAAFAAGRLTGDQVDVLAGIVDPEHRNRATAQGIDPTGVEAALVDLAVAGTHRELQQVTGHYLARLDPDGPEPDPTEDRALTLAQHPDGSWTLRGALDTVGGEKLATAVEALAAAGRGAGDDRSRAQRLADALVQLADLGLASGRLPILRTVKPHVILTIDHQDLADPHTGPGVARTALGATLSAARARWAACDAQLTRIVLDPDG